MNQTPIEPDDQVRELFRRAGADPLALTPSADARQHAERAAPAVAPVRPRLRSSRSSASPRSSPGPAAERRCLPPDAVGHRRSPSQLPLRARRCAAGVPCCLRTALTPCSRGGTSTRRPPAVWALRRCGLVDGDPGNPESPRATPSSPGSGAPTVRSRPWARTSSCSRAPSPPRRPWSGCGLPTHLCRARRRRRPDDDDVRDHRRGRRGLHGGASTGRAPRRATSPSWSGSTRPWRCTRCSAPRRRAADALGQRRRRSGLRVRGGRVGSVTRARRCARRQHDHERPQRLRAGGGPLGQTDAVAAELGAEPGQGAEQHGRAGHDDRRPQSGRERRASDRRPRASRSTTRPGAEQARTRRRR